MTEYDRWKLTPPQESPLPRCPRCDGETDTVYRDLDGVIIGCPDCLTAIDAWELYA